MLTDCGCETCKGDCPELSEGGEPCLACKHDRHPALENE